MRANLVPLASTANLTDPDLNAWIGARYEECGRVLILLESTHGAPGAQQRDDVLYWANGGSDPTFQKLYDACAVEGESRLEYFNRFACMNLVPEAIGPTNATKVRAMQLKEGARTLPERLRTLSPRVVWIASKAAQKYASQIAEAQGVVVVLSDHPKAWHSDLKFLQMAWERVSNAAADTSGRFAKG